MQKLAEEQARGGEVNKEIGVNHDIAGTTNGSPEKSGGPLVLNACGVYSG